MRCYIALGSNLGDRRAHLTAGLEALRDMGEIEASPLVMETPDESGLGPDFLNTVARLDAHSEDPRPILEALLRIELRVGRDRGTGRNAPRILDLDLIEADGFSGKWRWPAPEDLQALGDELTLVLPHPRAASRAFVQQPLAALRNGPQIPKDQKRLNCNDLSIEGP